MQCSSQILGPFDEPGEEERSRRLRQWRDENIDRVIEVRRRLESRTNAVHGLAEIAIQANALTNTRTRGLQNFLQHVDGHTLADLLPGIEESAVMPVIRAVTLGKRLAGAAS